MPPAQARRAAELATQLRQQGLNSFNLDLMHGLPGQNLADALADLQQAIDLNPPHLSWYQLTIEPNTAFASRPPVLPEDEALWDIQEHGHALLTAAGYQQYETSAYSKPGHQCQHNLNYWRYGDYAGVGPGAHGRRLAQATERHKKPENFITAVERNGHGLKIETDLPPQERVLNPFFVSRNFGVMIEEEGLALRGTFVLDPQGVIKVMEVHDLGIGRDASELKRKIQAAQYIAKNPGQACPAKWKEGDAALTPSLDLVGKI